MNEIIKGMANASEAIQENFEELNQSKTSHDTRLTTVEQNIDFVDITSGFSFASGVTNFYAYKFGRVAFLRFDYQPTETGFTQEVVTTTLYKPNVNAAVTVATSQSTLDSARGVTAHFLSSGNLTVVAPEVPGYPMLFTCMYFT